MNRQITRAAVIGAGVMGAQIAGVLANHGIEVTLLDVAGGEKGAPAQVRSKRAADGIQALMKLKPAPLTLPEHLARIRPGNLEDDGAALAAAQWIIEAVTEKLAVKQIVMTTVDAHRSPGALVTSNTSGLSLHAIAEGRSADFRKHFCGVHFFNPPRYMKLVELTPGPATDPAVLAQLQHLIERDLGKGVVIARDTPDFIANRIGVYALLTNIRAMEQMHLSATAVDAISGPLIGRAKSATLRTADVVGLDVIQLVAESLHAALAHDPERAMFQTPATIATLVKAGKLGQKNGAGYFMKDRASGAILEFDFKTNAYAPTAKAAFASVDLAKTQKSLGEKLKVLIAAPDAAGEFTRQTLPATLAYAAARLEEIADSVEAVDNALKWGFGWEAGPFELWDLLGVKEVAAMLTAAGRPVPPAAQAVLDAGRNSFYRREKGETFYFLPATKTEQKRPRPATALRLQDLKEQGKTVLENPGASLIDVGEGIVCLEFHSKMNAIGLDTLTLTKQAVAKAEQDFRGLIVANEGAVFSAGANLAWLLMAATDGEFDEIELMIRMFQQATMSIRNCKVPTVVAPHSMALGGGCEYVLHGQAVVSHEELYIGLVELGVGLIPAGGGTKEMARRLARDCAGPIDQNKLKAVFARIATAQVSGSAEEARRMGILEADAQLEPSEECLTWSARQRAILMAEAGWQPPEPNQEFVVAGATGLATCQMYAWLMQQAGQATAYDAYLAGELAGVLCGGDLPGQPKVSEQFLLDREREVFLRLCGRQESRERIQHMLKTGKPLRN
ncbi:MAG: 3-hydroxyacyl-CoA dehydrogenase NAD-binding domain-containing protein [Planctomycetota bacterium]